MEHDYILNPGAAPADQITLRTSPHPILEGQYIQTLMWSNGVIYTAIALNSYVFNPATLRALADELEKETGETAKK